jgi:hypothetical protein
MLPEDRYLLRIILDFKRNGALSLCGKHLLHRICADNIRALHFQAVPLSRVRRRNGFSATVTFS